MGDRIRIILLALLGSVVAFMFAAMMFFPSFTPRVAYDAVVNFVLRRRVVIDIVPFGEVTGLLEGQSAKFEDGLVVTFRSVDDSRCPPETQCVTAGDLTMNFDVKHGRSSATPKAESQLSIGFSRPSGVVPPYEFTLIDFFEGALTFTVSVKK